MNKKTVLRAALALALVAGTAVLAGCSSGTGADAKKNPDVWGYVTTAEKAQLELAENQDGVDQLVVDRVLAPGDAWIVVHADNNGKPGMRVGLKHVKRGESTNVRVPLKDLTTPSVIVAVHADRATKNKFDFDMMAKEMSPDRPFFVDEKELAKAVKVREFGIPTPAGTALVEAVAQPGAKATLTIDRVVAPEPAWIVVHLEKDGGPGGRVGLLHVPAGESSGLSVKLDPVALSDNLLVALHADKGTLDQFDFDMMDKINSIDQPYFVDGSEVAIKVPVK
ncbi:MAG: hypothetical protein FDZ75_00280 [Actinobacteria bacterium]|nr:MAG: hypothetical protein FDZ75_00280 [Actinomycetota bacterium]